MLEDVLTYAAVAALFTVFGVIALGGRALVRRWLPEGRLKRILLRDV